jgi:hypothetical protein
LELSSAIGAFAFLPDFHPGLSPNLDLTANDSEKAVVAQGMPRSLISDHKVVREREMG